MDGLACFVFTNLAVTSLSLYPAMASLEPEPPCTAESAPALTSLVYELDHSLIGTGLTAPLPPSSAVFVDVIFLATALSSFPP